ATHSLGHAGLGLIASAVGGALLAAVVAIATVRCCADQMVTGLAANILALGFASFLLRGLFGRGEAPIVRGTPLTPIPGRRHGDIAGVGPLLFRQPALTYVGLALVVAMLVVLRRTRAGLTLRAVGENPTAAFASGADPIRVRYLAVIGTGALAGI